MTEEECPEAMEQTMLALRRTAQAALKSIGNQMP
jgi:hypothetical protein